MEQHFYYSSHTPTGVVTLASALFDWTQVKDVLLLKGGAGFGKNAFLQTMAAILVNAGVDVEYLWCASHPQDLDGIVAPGLHCAALDATAPHVLEPHCPGGVERWVDLGRFCDVTATKALTSQSKRLILAEETAATAAHHTLHAARLLEQAIMTQVAPSFDAVRGYMRMTGIISRELTKGGEKGQCQRQFLSAFTPQGLRHQWQTITNGYSRVYCFCDRYHQGRACLAQIAQSISGWDTIACMNPIDPADMVHLLIPGLGLAFVTTSPWVVYPGDVYRQIHLDAMAYPEDKGRLRLQERLIQQLYAQAQEELTQSQSHYQQRSALLKPYVDGEAVTFLAGVEASRWLSYGAIERGCDT